MSDEKDAGEENENDEFEFYFSFTKPLVLDLPSSEERAIAAAWVQKLESDKDDKERLNYLKLLLFILQRGRLSGIFKKQPPSGPFEPFPPGFSIIDMGNLMLDQDDSQMFGGGDTRAVPYNIEISNDLREFVASQEVPKFGIQMYYAWSADDPVQKWAHFDEDKFPQFILDKIKQLKEDGAEKKDSETTCKKKTFELGRGEKGLKKKVKSPQEIEKSQGRSFHTYMGLVGRMGNYSKCEDDREKGFQRPERKGSPQRGKMQRMPPAGEGEDMCAEDDYDNFVTGLGGGLTSANRPCLCPYPCHHQDCPDFRKGPQSSDAQPNGPCPADNGYAQRSTAVRQASPKRSLREPSADSDGVTSQQRCGTATARSPDGPMNLNLPQDNQRGSSNKSGMCVCTSAQCMCPCPRNSPAAKTPPCGQGAPRLSGTASRTFLKPNQQDPRCGNQFTSRPGGEFLSSFKASDNYMDRQGTPNNTPVGGRSCASSPGKSLRPVTHCYDERNPDPCLTEVISRQPGIMAPQSYPNSPQCPPHETTFKARRKLFNPLAESTAIHDHVAQQSGVACSPITPGLLTHPDCENDIPGSEEFFSFMESDDEMNEDVMQYSRGITDTYKKSPQNNCNATVVSQQNRSLFAVPEGGGRLANIASVLQGLQQKTEAHREKCASGAIRKSSRADDNAGPCLVQQGTTPCGNQMGYDAGGNFSDSCSPQSRGDPNVYFTPQVPPREQPNLREVHTAPAKRDETQCMFLSNQIGYQGPSPDPNIKYFPTSTPPSPPKTNLVRYETYMSLEQCSENEGGYDEENYPCDSSSETFYDNQAMLKTQSAPCPTESYFFSPPRARQGHEDISHYTPPPGQSVKFQSGARSRPQSPSGSRGSSNVSSSPRRSTNAGNCRPSSQPQCPPPSPQRQTQPQCPPPSPQRQTQPQCPPPSPQRQTQPQCPPPSPQRQTQPQCPPPSPQRQTQPQCPPPSPQRQTQPQCPPPSPQRQTQPQCPPPSPQRQTQPQCQPQSPRHSQESRSSPHHSQQWSSPTKYVLPGDSWLLRGRGKACGNVNYLTPQYPPADRGNLRPQAVSTGGKYQTAANIHCPRPQVQPVCQRISFDHSTNSTQDFDDFDQDFENLCSSNMFIEADSYETDPELAACESVPQC